MSIGEIISLETRAAYASSVFGIINILDPLLMETFCSTLRDGGLLNRTEKSQNVNN